MRKRERERGERKRANELLTGGGGVGGSGGEGGVSPAKQPAASRKRQYSTFGGFSHGSGGRDDRGHRKPAPDGVCLFGSRASSCLPVDNVRATRVATGIARETARGASYDRTDGRLVGRSVARANGSAVSAGVSATVGLGRIAAYERFSRV